MAFSMRDLMHVALCNIVMVVVLAPATHATKYTVGGSPGWVVGEDMEAWGAQHTFYVGDELYFPYPYGQSSVLLVTEEDYNDCNANRAISSDGGLGNMAMTLLTAETYFFISGHPEQCTEGLRLEVHVLEVGASKLHSPPPPVSEEEDHTPPSTNNNNIPSSPVILSPPRSINTPYSTFRPTSSSPPPSSISSLLLALTFFLAIVYVSL
ncbi:hypothetical protein GOP47_0026056 [Adiantum capillus-veneris]|uniref:Phytocyanin domain-containing protein n=1 Tax=Adiantum capillus-veneris TaxID=13818 RepID=A0A9D4Z449_ADICA|nr:hypothetical protein GOP47_0025566 [Adiantum capillus-veneris]KAI5059737.1 hypothetical protein GOP47_0026056 [Adiantum capillus-veneris]